MTNWEFPETGAGEDCTHHVPAATLDLLLGLWSCSPALAAHMGLGFSCIPVPTGMQVCIRMVVDAQGNQVGFGEFPQTLVQFNLINLLFPLVPGPHLARCLRLPLFKCLINSTWHCVKIIHTREYNSI